MNTTFVSKSAVKNQLDTSRSFREAAMIILFALQTEYEQETDQTINRNRQGFMSSHAVNGSRVARKLKVGEPLDERDSAHVDAIAPRYSRQLAVYFRAQESVPVQPVQETDSEIEAQVALDMFGLVAFESI